MSAFEEWFGPCVGVDGPPDVVCYLCGLLVHRKCGARALTMHHENIGRDKWVKGLYACPARKFHLLRIPPSPMFVVWLCP